MSEINIIKWISLEFWLIYCMTVFFILINNIRIYIIKIEYINLEDY
jgi:hypothetical protein